MTTHNEAIFHCLTCGAVSHAVTRECCGHPMVLAAQATVKDSEESPASHAGHPEARSLKNTRVQASLD